jgi:hypothetical protein
MSQPIIIIYIMLICKNMIRKPKEVIIVIYIDFMYDVLIMVLRSDRDLNRKIGLIHIYVDKIECEQYCIGIFDLPM